MEYILPVKEKKTIDNEVVKAFEFFLMQCQGVTEVNKKELKHHIKWNITINDKNVDSVINDIDKTLEGIKIAKEYITQYPLVNGVLALVPFENEIVVLNVSYETSFYYTIARVETKRNKKNVVLTAKRLTNKYINKVRKIAFYIYLLNKIK